MRVDKLVWLPAIGAMACWGGEPWTPPVGASAWRPTSEVPAGWSIATVESPLACPDGELAVATVVAPTDATATLAGVALVLPDGSFDYVLAPDLADPLAGAHLQDPSRLEHDWALRQSWAVAGLYRSGDPAVEHSGAIAIALARRDVAVVVPSLCWGDYTNAVGDSSALEGFERLGAEMVTWTWEGATSDPQSLGLASAPDQALLIALGEGGRGAGALLRTTGRAPDALLVDSADDDLDVYWDDPGAWGDRIAGLERIYPGGAAQAANHQLAFAPFPTRTVLAYSSADPRMPAGALDALRDRIPQGGGRVVDTELTRHVQTAGDPALADELVGWLLGEDGVDTDP